MSASTTPATSADIAGMQRVLHNDGYAYSRDVIAQLKAMQADQAAQSAALLAQLKAAPVASGAGTTTGTSTAAPTVDYFPANAANAPVSPDESFLRRAPDGTIGGSNPHDYLVDQNGTLVQMVAPVAAGTAGVILNGTMLMAGNDPGAVVSLVLKRNGTFWFQWANGFQKVVTGGGVFYNTTFPAPASASSGSSGSASPGTPATVTPPTRTAVAPGSTGNVVHVSPGGMYAAVLSLKDGDTLMVAPGSYNEEFHAFSASVLVTADKTQPLPHFSGAGLTGKLAMGKGLFVAGTDLILENLVISDVAMDQDGAQSTAAVRPNDGCAYIEVRGCEIYNSQFGIAGGGFPCHFVIGAGTNIHDCGIDDRSHNVYVSGGGTILDITGATIHDPKTAHAVKSRADMTTVVNTTLSSATGSAINIPDGSKGASSLTGCTVVKPAGSGDHKVITVGDESAANGTTALAVSNTVFDCECDSPFFATSNGSSIALGAGVTFKGTKPTAQGTVSGL